jgi:polysaccharide export outer membrane protein
MARTLHHSSSVPLRKFGWFTIAVFLLCHALAGQDPGVNEPDSIDHDAFQARLKNRTFASAEILKQFQGPADENYQLGCGDEITLDVWGHPELSGKHQIGPDGRITLAVAGSVSMAGLTREESAQTVTHAYSKLYSNLSMIVRVDRYASNRIFILGRVANPGAILFDRPPTLLEAITRAGSLPVGGMGAEKAALTRCAIFRGRDQVAWIDLKGLLTGGNLALNLQLRRDDIVYVPDADDQLVYVLGEVKTPGAVHLTPEMSFLDALALAGGPNEDASNGKIHLIRPSRELNREIKLNQLLRPDPTLNMALEEGDIIYVPKSKIGKVGYLLQRLGTLSGFAVVGGALAK